MAVEIKGKVGYFAGLHQSFWRNRVNYRPDQEPNDIALIGEVFVEFMRKFLRQQVLVRVRILELGPLCWRLMNSSD